MAQPHTEFLSAVLLVSPDPSRLAAFYRDVLGVPLKEERHDDTHPHFGATLGDLHFAIHPVDNFPMDKSHGTGSVRLAFTIFDMDAFMARLAANDIEPLYEPRETGFALMTALVDPDGNTVEFTQLSDGWYRHLREHRDHGGDILLRWQALQP